MNKFLLAGVLFVFSLSLQAQSNLLPRVGILKTVNATGNASFDPGIKAVGDTVTLILVQSGLYQVGQLENSSPPDNESALLKNLAETAHWDYLVSTRLEQQPAAEESKILFKLAVYDRRQNQITISRTSDPVNLLDLFEAADATVASALGKMTGIHIGFGKLILKNIGESGAYSIKLDGRQVGQDELNRILNGWHEVSVVQKRMKGETLVTTAKLNIVDNTAQELLFAVPYLTYEESLTLADAQAKIDALWDSSQKTAEMDQAFADYLALFRDVSYSPRLAAWKSRIETLQNRWKEHLSQETRGNPPAPAANQPQPFAFIGVTGGLVYDSRLSKPWVRDGGIDFFLPFSYFYTRLQIVYLKSDTNTYTSGNGSYTKSVSTWFFKPGLGLNIPLTDDTSIHGGMHFCFGDVPGNDGPLSAGDITAGTLVNLGDHWGMNLEVGIAGGCYDDNGTFWHSTARLSFGYAF